MHNYIPALSPLYHDHTTALGTTFMIDKGILEKTLKFAPGEMAPVKLYRDGNGERAHIHKSRHAEKEIEKYLQHQQ